MTGPPPAGRPPAGPPPAPDPGRQPKRTQLAWRRTTLTVTVLALLELRFALHAPLTAPRGLAMVAITVAWLAVLLTARDRRRRVATTPPPQIGWAVPLLTLIAVGFAGLGLVLVATA